MKPYQYEYVFKECNHVEAVKFYHGETWLRLHEGQWTPCPYCKLERQIAKVLRISAVGQRVELTSGRCKSTKWQKLHPKWFEADDPPRVDDRAL